MRTRFIVSGILLAIVLVVGCKRDGYVKNKKNRFKAKKYNDTCIFPKPEPRDFFLGRYQVVDSLFVGGQFKSKTNYTLLITNNYTVSDTIYLNNLWGNDESCLAIVVDSNFNIPSQQVNGKGYISGSGRLGLNIVTYEISGDVYLHKCLGTEK